MRARTDLHTIYILIVAPNTIHTVTNLPYKIFTK